jgi:hypothetical protein
VEEIEFSRPDPCSKIEEARSLRGQCFEEADALANAVSAQTFAALDNVEVHGLWMKFAKCGVVFKKAA